MSLLVALVIGIAIGAGGQFVLQKELDTLLISVIAGMVGSILGLVAFALFDFNQASTSLFSLPLILFCAIGALLAVLIFASLHQFTERHTEAKVDTEDMETESKIEKDPEEEKE